MSHPILIVEDEASFAQLVADRVTKAGFEVAWCGKINEARDKLAKEKFGCVLLDMSLQSGSGEDLITFVRQHRYIANFETPIVVMSGFLNDHLVGRIKDKVTHIFQKPFDYDQLLKKLAEIMPGVAKGEGVAVEIPNEELGHQAFDTSTERSFLHTLANFLAIADGNIDIAFQRTNASPKKDPETFLRIHEGLKAIREACLLLESRRAKIIKQAD